MLITKQQCRHCEDEVRSNPELKICSSHIAVSRTCNDNSSYSGLLRSACNDAQPLLRGNFNRTSIIVLILLCFISCTPKKQIELLSYQKEKCYESLAVNDTTDLKLCAEWQLDSLDILEILKSSEPTDFRTIHILCSVLPCEYTGEAIINGNLHKYEINAGGFTTLWRDNNISYLIYDKESNFFLEEFWNPEMEDM